MDILFNKISRKMRSVLYGVVMVAATVGCSEEIDTISPEETTGKVPLQVTADISVSGEVETRAVTQSIGVSLVGEGGYTQVNNVRYDQIDGKSWQVHNPDNTIYLSSAYARLTAYFPYGETTSDGKYLVMNNQIYNEKKVLYYTSTGGYEVNMSNPSATFNMELLYSRLRLHIKRGSYTGGNCKISSITLSGADNQFVNSGNHRLINPMISGGGLVQGGWKYNYNVTLRPGQTNTGYDVLLMPQTTRGGLKITMVIDGKDSSITLPSVYELYKGEMTTLTLTIESRGITLAGIQQEDYDIAETKDMIVNAG